MTKRKRRLSSQDEFERGLARLTVVLVGGEYRETIPGRGITIVQHYRTFYTVFGEAMTEAFRQVNVTLDGLQNCIGGHRLEFASEGHKGYKNDRNRNRNRKGE